MAPPDIASSTIEQAIYTWSEINRGGNKGLGFGAVSPGLRNHSDWLNSWPTSKLQLRAESLRGAEAFPGWEQAVTIGAFQVDDFNVVYRKIPSAGIDGVGRNRHVVHALVGQPADLDLARIAPDSVIWHSAADCPLDDLPTLASLSALALPPASFAHTADEHDVVVELIERLRLADPTLFLDDLPPEAADDLARSLHVAIPTGLWPNIELTFHLANDGLRAAIGISSRPLNATVQPSSVRLALVELAGCGLHQRIDDLWTTHTPRSWSRFTRTLTPETLAASRPLSPASDDSADNRGDGRHARAPGHPAAITMRELVAEATGWSDWHYERPLDDLAIARILSSSGIDAILPTWLQQATGDELRAVLALVRERRVYAALNALLLSSSVATRDVVAAWQRSAAAPLGYALAERSAKRSLGKRWALPAVPAEDHAIDAQLLAEQLVTSEPGHDACVAMFKGGILRHPQWRGQMVRGLLAAKASPQFVFDRLMVESGADERILCHVALEHLDEFATWLTLPDAYREAFRTGLAKPRWFWRFARVLSEQHTATARD